MESINRDEWERMRLNTYILKKEGYLKKSTKLKDFMPLGFDEHWTGSTVADNKMVEAFKKWKKNYNNDNHNKGMDQ